MDEDKTKKSKQDDFQESLNEVINQFRSIRVPNFPVLERELKRTKSMTFNDYKTINIHTIPDSEKLDTLETMAGLIVFQEDTTKFLISIKEKFQGKHPIYDLRIYPLSEEVKLFVKELSNLDIMTSEFKEPKVNPLKHYMIMQFLQSYFDEFSPETFAQKYVKLFEAVVTQFLKPIARKMDPKLQKRDYIPPRNIIIPRNIISV